MRKDELELIIKRLNSELGLSKDTIKVWLNTPCFNYTNCTPIEYLKVGMFGVIINKIDSLIENKNLYKF